MRARRSGIANIVGAVFFILIVVLMVGALATMFGTFNSYVDGQHTSNASTLSAQAQAVGVQDIVFGGLTSYSSFNYATTGSVTLSQNNQQNPILPISNMNFTSNMDGWTTSRSYTPVSDTGSVQTSPQNIYPSSSSPSTVPFTLTVTNGDPLGSPYGIAKVSLLVDSQWTVPVPQPTTVNWGSTFLATGPPNVTGNNITWLSSLPFEIGPNGGSQTFDWSASVPNAHGTFYMTVVVSWLKNSMLPFTDTAIATVNATVASPLFSGTTTAASPTILTDAAATWTAAQWFGDFLQYTSGPAMGQSLEIIGNGGMTITTGSAFNPAPTPTGNDNFIIVALGPGTSIAAINPAPSQPLTPSGMSAGYDSNTLVASSESAPGSLYATFEPSFNSVPISDGQQLTSTADFTTSFYLDQATAANIAGSKCCTLTWDSDMASINAPRDSLVLYQVYLQGPKGTIELPIGGTSCGASPSDYYYVNPTVQNDFGPSGWVTSDACFIPPVSWTTAGGGWYAGTYTLTISVAMTVPGQFPESAGYPPALSVYLDNVGLALKPDPATYYGSQTFELPTGLSYNQVQGLELGVNMTSAPQNTTIYAFVSDNSRFVYNPVLWAQFGSASTTNASVIDTVIPLPQAAYYVNSTTYTKVGVPETGDLNIRINATSSACPAPAYACTEPLTPYTVKVSIYAVIQTFNETRAVVELKNLSNTDIKLLSLVITGPGAALTSNFASNFYFSPGQKIIMAESFDWIPGQIYTVTVTTAIGLTFSRSFTAPLS